MFALLSDLIDEWRGRLAACRKALSAADEDGPDAQYLRIHERILKYLLDRYQDQPPDPWPASSAPRRRRRYPPPLPVYLEVSELHPPRSRQELREHLQFIHSALRKPHRTWWHAVIRRRPRHEAVC